MGGTIDDEMRGHPYYVLPHTHAGACRAVEQIHLVAAADVVEEKVKVLCERYEVPRGYTDYREMIETERPDLLCIATRPVNHQEIIVFAAERGVRAMYCEKPLCCSMAEADALRAACEEHGVKFNYGTNRRFMPLFWKMREIIDGGGIGNLQSVTALNSSVAQWGLTHAADMLLYLAQDAEIEFVQGHIACDEADFEDNRLDTDPPIHLGYVQFRSGVRGYVVTGMGYEFEVSGSAGRLRTLNDTGALSYRHVHGERNLLAELPAPHYAHESGTINALRDLVRALDTDGDTLGNVTLACRSQEMIIGFVESHRQGGARVALPLENRELYVGTW
jgi:predicted dehydrogenase